MNSVTWDVILLGVGIGAVVLALGAWAFIRLVAVPAWFFVRSKEGKLNAVAVALIAAVVWMAYENNWKGVFVFDDDHAIVENPSIKHIRFEDFEALKEDLRSIVAYDPARTVTSLTFALNFKYSEKEWKNGAESVEKFSAVGFHAVNNYIHFIVSVLVFFVVRKIIKMYRGANYTGWAGHYFPALIAALLFAGCPVNSESVTYIVQRSESLCSMFVLAGLLCFLHARTYQAKHYGREHEGIQKSRKQAQVVRRHTFAWVAAGPVLLLVVYVILSMSLAPSGRPPTPDEVSAVQQTALYTVGALAAVYFLALVGAVAIFPRRIQWGGDLRLLEAFFYFGMAALSKQIALIFPFLLLLVEFAVLRAGRKGYMRAALKYHSLFLATFALVVILWLVLQGAPANPAIQREGKIDTGYFAQQVSNSVVLKYAGKMLLPLCLNIDPDIGPFGEQAGDKLISLEFAALVLLIIFAVWLCRYSRLAGFGLLWFFVALIPSSSVLQLADVMAEHRVYLAGMGLFMAVGVAVTEAARLVRARIGRIAAAGIVALSIGLIVAVDVGKVRERNEKYYSAVTLWGDTVKHSPDKARPYTGIGFVYMNRGSIEGVVDACNKAKADLRDYETEKSQYHVDNPKKREAVLDECKAVDRQLDGPSLELAKARVFLETAELYEQRGLWQPKIVVLPDPSVANSRWSRIQLNRVYNNLGVVYSYQSEIQKNRRDFAGILMLNEDALEANLAYAWMRALKYYGLSLGLYPLSVEALVNSSRIRWGIGLEYYAKAKAAATEEEKNKYLDYFEYEADVAATMVLRAIMVDRHAPIALQQMFILHRALALYYYNPAGPPEIVNTSEPEETREKKGLMHWRYFRWASIQYPRATKQEEAMMDQAIAHLRLKYPNEPDPFAGAAQP